MRESEKDKERGEKKKVGILGARALLHSGVSARENHQDIDMKGWCQTGSSLKGERGRGTNRSLAE